MSTVYIDRMAFWKDDATGMIWDSPKRKFQYTMTEEEVKTESGIPVTIYATEDPLICSHCGFEAKSKAGLAVHKMRH